MIETKIIPSLHRSQLWFPFSYGLPRSSSPPWPHKRDQIKRIPSHPLLISTGARSSLAMNAVPRKEKQGSEHCFFSRKNKSPKVAEGLYSDKSDKNNFTVKNLTITTPRSVSTVNTSWCDTKNGTLPLQSSSPKPIILVQPCEKHETNPNRETSYKIPDQCFSELSSRTKPEKLSQPRAA